MAGAGPGRERLDAASVKRIMKRIALLPLLLVAACQTGPERGVNAALAVLNAKDWSDVIAPQDAVKLGARAGTWERALALTVQQNPQLLAEEGALVRPGGEPAVPPVGTYDCRTIKLGMEMLGGIAYEPFRCCVFMQDGQSWLVKETGSQRHSGRIFSDGTFLGGLALGKEQGSIAYGSLEERDVVGVVERLPDGRYRLVQPEPQYESQLDILELVVS